MQTKREIEDFYKKRDPWGYTNNAEDKFRKETILEHLPKRYKRALDIGAGEGWITKDLPARYIHAIEWSDTAAERLPDNIKRVKEPEGEYDLMITTGTLYPQYDHEQILNWLNECKGTILTCNIQSWEVDTSILGEPTTQINFGYRGYTQHLCVYDRTLTP